jgi:hypothetical protein
MIKGSGFKERKRNWERNHKRFLASIYRKKKRKGHTGIRHIALKHTPNIQYLSAKRDAFSESNVSKHHTGNLFVPEIFSLCANPKESFLFLKELLYILYNQSAFDITIDYKKCKRIDIDASITMDVILKDCISHIKKSRRHGYRCNINSIKPIGFSPEIKKFLYATGLFKNLGLVNIHFEDVVICELCTGYYSKMERRDIDQIRKKEVEVTKLIDYIDKCLTKMHRSPLAPDAKKHFANVIGEIITNAEQHSSTNFRYSVGYFKESTSSEEHIGEFNVVIFNFGETIYERINHPVHCVNKNIVTDMKNLSSRYTSRGFFGTGFKEETLWTLYSLQDGVSSISPHRGNGTIKFIESFFRLKGDNLKDEKSHLTILSGNARIVFDGTYEMTKRVKNGENFKVIAFNTEGDWEALPDKKYVTFTENYFPGTMIATKIFIKDENVTRPNG